MKHFLIHGNLQTKKFTIVEHSKTIKRIETDTVLILFDGTYENILENYSQQGINFIKNISSAFSLFLYDKKSQKVYIAKDKVGIKPLYYFQDNANVIIGTHLKRFLKIKNFKAEISPSTVGEYLQFGFILQPNTIFQDTYKICAGEYLTFTLNTNPPISTKYWTLESCYQHEKYQHSEERILKETDELLNKFVDKSIEEENNAFSLSGGYDSSTLVAIAQKQKTQKVDTFTIGFEDSKIDEAPAAKAIAKALGTNHHEYYFTAQDALNVIPKMSEIFDEPFADYASSPTIMTAQLLKEKNVNLLVAGDGGDEVFATAENVHGFERLKKTPKLLKTLLANSINAIKAEHIPYLKDYKNLPIKQHKLYQLLLEDTIPKMVYNRNVLFLEKELELLVKSYTKPLVNAFDNIEFTDYAESVDEVIGSYFKSTMVDGELVKSYSAMNYHDINISTPFLEEELIQYMAQVPSSLKIKNGVKKYLLKEIAHQYIPKELMERPKSGFDIPFASWMRNELKEILLSQINKKRLDKDNIFYTTSILNIRDTFYAGNDAYKYKLWRIFIFQLWYENFQQLSQHTKD